jgi:hypothetical protein
VEHCYLVKIEQVVDSPGKLRKQLLRLGLDPVPGGDYCLADVCLYEELRILSVTEKEIINGPEALLTQ